MPIGNSPRKTAVYVDGYNLYYGRLRGTKFKWFDIVKFFDRLLASRDQNESLICVRVFTAPALASFASNATASVEAQAAYYRALHTLHPERFETVFGTHTYDKGGTLLPAFITGQNYDRQHRVRVWKLEEKKTDVNLALHMYRDACKGLYERLVLVSNDSDAEPALKAIREDFPAIMIGVVIPVHPPSAEKTWRRASGSLIRLAHWILPCLTDEQLAEAQLPDKVPTRKKPILKPRHW